MVSKELKKEIKEILSLNDALTQKEIIEKVEYAKARATIWRALDELEKEGNITQTKIKGKDQRFVYYTLTSETDRVKYKILNDLENSDYKELNREIINSYLDFNAESTSDYYVKRFFKDIDMNLESPIVQKTISLVLSRYSKLIINDLLGLNILFSSPDNQVLDLWNLNEINFNENNFNEKTFAFFRLLSMALQLAVDYTIQEGFDKPFQVTFRYVPKELENAIRIDDKIIEDVLVSEEIIPKNYTITDILKANETHKDTFDEIVSTIKTIQGNRKTFYRMVSSFIETLGNWKFISSLGDSIK